MVGSHHKKKVTLINSIIGLCLLIVVLILVANVVKVPYEKSESYTVEEEYEAVEVYTSAEEYEVKLPYLDYEETTEEIAIGTPSELLDPRPTQNPSDCYLIPYNFTVNYSQPATEHNKYDPVTKAGYYAGAVRIMATICNNERIRRGMSTDLKVCNYFGDTKVDCIDSLKTHVAGGSCVKRMLRWNTAFDPQKHIKLEMGTVSSKMVCKTNYVSRGREGKDEYTAISRIPYDIKFNRFIVDKSPRIKTQSGYFAVPRSRENFFADEVASAVKRKVTEVVKYRTETRERPVERNRTVTKTRTVEKERPVTGYRSLWQHIMVRIAEMQN